MWADELSDEHHDVPPRGGYGHQRWEGQPHKVLVSGDVKNRPFSGPESHKKGRV